jgi:O-antigen/teichoic acid export membrane protein
MSSERGQARLLASGSLAQQAAQVTGLVAMFVIVTVLARRLSLAELGAYGLLSSLAGYLLIVQNAGAGAAVRDMAAAEGDEARDSVYSTAAFLYAVAGLGAGSLVALLGVALAAGIELPGGVRHDAQVGALLLGGVTAVGWPLTVNRDALRAQQQFVRAAATELVALLVYLALVLGLVYGGANLALVIAASGTIPLLSGLGCTAVARSSGLPFRFQRDSIRASTARRLAGTAGYLSLTEAFATSIYVVNRTILGLFKSAAVVGLYEGPVRAHNLLRSLNAAETVTALPTASRYHAEGDSTRQSELLVRGTRYTLALVVPIAVTAMVLAAPLLDAWLGPGFRGAGGAMAILMAHWLVSGCTGLLTAILVGLDKARYVARWAGTVAVANLVLALALVPPLGLEGVAIATSVPYLALFPLLLQMALRATSVRFAALTRVAFAPAYALAAVLATVLGALRLSVGLDEPFAVGAAVVLAPLAYWAAYYVLWLEPAERRLVRDVGRDLVTTRPQSD